MTTDRATACRVCAAPLEPFMTFGRMPIANGFLAASQIPEESFFELAPAFCAGCGMFQIVEQPAPEQMFHEQYAFYSSTSRHMQAHFGRFAAFVRERFLDGRSNPFVVELGSNDGIMLRHFRDAGLRHLGVEPSANVADLARADGIDTISAFFGPALADEILETRGRADAVLAANVMCHIPDIHGVAAGVARVLSDTGVLVFEDPYLGDMVAKTSYDQIYDEHVFIFSATSVASAFRRHGLELVDVLPQPTHGGSMRYVLGRTGAHPVAPAVPELLAREREQGLADRATFDRFRASCEASRDALRELLDGLRRSGNRIAGYGATSKSTTVTNYCGIGSEHLEFISDTTPIKQGKLSPGAHIPVQPHERFASHPPDYALLFAWNHAAEIFEKEQAFTASGGQWITYVPNVAVVR